MLDVLIRNGWVADGAGSPPFLGDVAIQDGKIAEVGRLGDNATASKVIDAAGKIVCPGFVDPHSHSDFSILANPRPRKLSAASLRIAVPRYVVTSTISGAPMFGNRCRSMTRKPEAPSARADSTNG